MDMILQKQAQEILDAAVVSGEENSIQFCVYRDGSCLVNACAGWLDYGRSRPVDTHTIFPVYSTSKGGPAVALTRLISQGKVSVHTQVAEIWPEFATNGKEKTLVEHLLRHTSGLKQRLPEQQTYEQVADWPTMIQAIEKSEPDWEPGTKTRYQSLTYGWVTGEIIQRITGMSFRDYMIKELFEPADIRDFYYGTTEEAECNAAEIRCVGVEPTQSDSVCDPLDELMRQPCIRKAALPGFNAIASAHGLASFYNAVLAGNYFSRDMLKKATTLNRPEPGLPSLSGDFGNFGYGFALSGQIDDVGNVFGHGGYGGSDALADQKQNLTVGMTFGNIGDHPCKAKLFKLIGLVQREGWLP